MSATYEGHNALWLVSEGIKDHNIYTNHADRSPSPLASPSSPLLLLASAPPANAPNPSATGSQSAAIRRKTSIVCAARRATVRTCQRSSQIRVCSPQTRQRARDLHRGARYMYNAALSNIQCPQFGFDMVMQLCKHKRTGRWVCPAFVGEPPPSDHASGV